MSVGEEVARGLDRIPNVDAFTGTFLGVEDGRARVRTEAGEVLSLSRSGDAWPPVGSAVWCLIVGTSRIMLGQPNPPSRTGRVVSLGTGTAVVQYPSVDGVEGTFRLARGATAEVGDEVIVDHELAAIVAAYGSTAPPPPTPDEPDGPPTTAEQTAEVNAAWDGTVTPAGFWLPSSSSLYTRNSGGGPNYATVGYGDGVTRLGIAAASVVSAEVYTSVEKLGSAHEVGTHTLTGRSGTPSPTRTRSVSPRTGWVPLSIEAARALASGDARGVTFYGGAGTVYRSRSVNPGNGRVRLRYRVEG